MTLTLLILKPISSAIAFMSGVPAEDFDSFDAAKIYVEISNTNAHSLVNGVSVKLYGNNGLLAINSFYTKTVGNRIYIKEPSVFKSWVENYQDEASKIQVTLNQDTVYFGSGSIKSSFYYDDNLIDYSISDHTCIDEAGENTYFCTKV